MFRSCSKARDWEDIILSIIFISRKCCWYLKWHQAFKILASSSTSACSKLSVRFLNLFKLLITSCLYARNMSYYKLVFYNHFSFWRMIGKSTSSRGFNCFMLRSSFLIDFSILFFLRSSLALIIAGSIFFFFFMGSALMSINFGYVDER